MANIKEDKLRNLKKSYTEGAMIVFFCNNIRKRKQMTEVFFMDDTTGKHNWMWFLSNAEKELNNRRRICFKDGKK